MIAAAIVTVALLAAGALVSFTRSAARDKTARMEAKWERFL
jgi:hypothetical protein